MSWAIWITGLPGSGKSSLARGTASELATRYGATPTKGEVTIVIAPA